MQGGSKLMKTRSQVLWRILPLLVFTACATTTPRAGEESVVYRHHSIGASAMLQAPDGARARDIWALPQTAELRQQVTHRLGQVVQKEFSSTAPNSAETVSNEISALLADLADQENLLDVRGPEGRLEWTLAIKLPEARQKAWQAGLPRIVSLSNLGSVSASKLDGVEASIARLTQKQLQLSWSLRGEWLLVGLAPKLPATWSTWAASLKQTGRPAAASAGPWFQVQADLARLRKTFPLLPEFLDSKLMASVTPKNDGLRTDAKLTFSKPLNWKAEAWNLPTDSIRDPLVGFAAARGIEPLLRKNEELKLLQLPTYPNQACAWSLARVPYFTFAAYPQTGVSNLLWNALPNLPNVITNHGKLVGQLLWVSNTSQIIWQGMPIITPLLQPFADSGREFLFAGMMPAPAIQKKPPGELFAFTNKANLAYYDWEITEERILSWRRIFQVGLLGFMREAPRNDAPSQKFLDELGKGKRVGNTISEVTVTGPSELTFVRHSHSGFTGFELVNLCRWIDSANFPYTYESAPPIDLKKLSLDQRAHRATNAPSKGPEKKSVTPTAPSRQLPSRTGTNGVHGAKPLTAPKPAPKSVAPATPSPEAKQP